MSTTASVDAPQSQPPHADERLDAAEHPDHMGSQHWARYEWACRFLPAERVLDCACGVGYGSALLRRRGAKAVVGVDVSEDAIHEAQRRYAGKGIEYRLGDGRTLSPQSLGTFDRIVCLETIEHMDEPQRMLDAFASLLKPDGLLALSVPNDKHLGVQNPYHKWRSSPEEVRGWISQRFAQVVCFGETHTIGTMIWPAAVAEAREEPAEMHDAPVRLIDHVALASCPGYLFACSQSPLPASPAAGCLLLDGFGFVRELQEVSRKLWTEVRDMAAGFDERGRRVVELEAEVGRVVQEMQRLAAGYEERGQHIASLEAQCRQAAQDAQALAAGFEERGRRVQELDAEVARLCASLEERAQLVEQLEAEKQRFWKELQELAAGFEERGRVVHETEETCRRLWDEKQELARKLAEQASEMQQLREELARTWWSKLGRAVKRRVRR